MPKRLRVRVLSEHEQRVIEKLSRAPSVEARLVQRASIIRLSHQGRTVQEIARQLDLDEDVPRKWISRFNEQGIAGLRDAPRSGAPSRYTPEHKALVIQTVRTRPRDLGLSFGSWTFDRLAAYLHDQRGLQMKRTRIIELVQQEGLRWHQQEHWFGERLDPAFEQKRGPSNG